MTLQEILESVKSGSVSVEEAERILKKESYEEICNAIDGAACFPCHADGTGEEADNHGRSGRCVVLGKRLYDYLRISGCGNFYT